MPLIFSSLKHFFFFTFICVCVCGYQRTFQELVLSLYHVGSGTQLTLSGLVASTLPGESPYQSLLQSFDVLNYISCILNVEPAFKTWNKSLFLCCIILIHCWVWFANILCLSSRRQVRAFFGHVRNMQFYLQMFWIFQIFLYDWYLV